MHATACTAADARPCVHRAALPPVAPSILVPPPPPQHPSRPLHEAIVQQRSTIHWAAFKPQELNNLLWALGRAECLPPGQARLLGNHLAQVLLDCFPSAALVSLNISNSIWGLARLGATNREVYQAAFELYASKPEFFSASEAAHLMAAWVRSGSLGPAQLRRLCSDMVGLAAGLELQPLVVKLVWPLADSGVADVALWAALCRRLVAELSSLTPEAAATPATAQQLGLLAWSLGTVGYSEPYLLHAISSHALAHMSAYGPQPLANLAWCFGRLKYYSAPFYDAAAQRVIQMLPSLNSSDLSAILHGLAISSHYHPTLFSAAAGRLKAELRRQQQPQGQGAPPSAPHPAKQQQQREHSSQGDAAAGEHKAISTLLYSFALLNHYDAELFALLTQRALALAAHMSPVSVALVLWAHATSGHQDAGAALALFGSLRRRFTLAELDDAALMLYHTHVMLQLQGTLGGAGAAVADPNAPAALSRKQINLLQQAWRAKSTKSKPHVSPPQVRCWVQHCCCARGLSAQLLLCPPSPSPPSGEEEFGATFALVLYADNDVP